MKIMSLLKCFCNDGGDCSKNKTCETEGFCYQRLVIQNKNGKLTKKIIKGCSSNKQIDFYYCTHSSYQTNLICCQNDFCNNQQMEISYFNLRQLLSFSLFIFLIIVLIILVIIIIRRFVRISYFRKNEIIIENAKNKPKLYNQLEILSLIKKGKFKQSFYGKRLGEKLFIKIFNEKAKENWLNEVEVYNLLLIRHENIVDFVGKDHLLIVTIYYEIGSLTNYLKNNRNLNENQILRLMLSAAEGVNHLHQDLEFKPSVVHRNLNSDNFIVVADESVLKCKLTDFSNALTYTRYERLEKERNLKKLKKIVCDLKYCPPEYFNQKIDYKNFLAFQTADVYSFSLILWQIANHQADNQVRNHFKSSVNNQENFNRSNSNYVDSDQEVTENEKQNVNKYNKENKFSNQIYTLEYRYLKPYEEYLMSDEKKSEFSQMKELLIDDSFITRPTIYFDATTVQTFNGYVIPKLIDESWSSEPNARLSIQRIVKDLTNLLNVHLKHIKK